MQIHDDLISSQRRKHGNMQAERRQLRVAALAVLLIAVVSISSLRVRIFDISSYSSRHLQSADDDEGHTAAHGHTYGSATGVRKDDSVTNHWRAPLQARLRRRLKNRDVCVGRRPSARARPLPCPTTLVTVRHFTPLATRSGARAVCLGQRSDNLTWVNGASGVRPTWVRVLRVSRTLRAHPNPRTQVASRTHARCPPPPPPTGRAPSQDPGTRRRDSHHHFPTTRYA